MAYLVHRHGPIVASFRGPAAGDVTDADQMMRHDVIFAPAFPVTYAAWKGGDEIEVGLRRPPIGYVDRATHKKLSPLSAARRSCSF